MATIKREPIGELHEKIVVSLSQDDYKPAFEQALKSYAKNANVPGFRKGKVPTGMVRKMYGPSVFQDEVLRAAGRQIDEYVTEQKLSIFGQPMVMAPEQPLRMDMDQPTDFEFAFEIGLKPEVTTPALESGQALTLYKIQVTDEMLDDEVKRLARRFGKVENPETVTGKENILYAKFRLNEEGAEATEETILIDKLPQKLQDLLMGRKSGDKFSFRPEEVATAEELPVLMKDSLKRDIEDAGKEFELEITKLGLLVPHEVDALLFSQVFPNDAITEEAAFREKLREELGREYARVGENRLNDEIFEMLVHTTPMNLPVPFLKRWLREGGEKPRSESQVESEFPGFDHQLRWTLISDKLLQESGVTVTHEEVLADMKGRVLAHFGMSADDEAPWIDDYMKKLSTDSKTMNETHNQLLFGKLFAWLRSKFPVEEREVTEKEFMELANPHHAHHHHH